MTQESQPVAELLFRVAALEKDIGHLKSQLNQYVPARENDLQLQSIRATCERIERDVTKTKEQIDSMNTRMLTQEQEAQKRDAAQRESQDKLQIRVAYAIIGTIATALVGLIIAFFTRLF